MRELRHLASSRSWPVLDSMGPTALDCLRRLRPKVYGVVVQVSGFR